MYVLDSNVFIEASRRYYGHDFAPAFWTALEANAKAGKVLTIDRVELELNKMKDDLSTWMQASFKTFVKPSNDVNVATVYSGMVGWVVAQPQYLPGAKSEFATVADGWLIAYAKHHGLTLVTHEVLDPHSKKRVPMPNVCQQFGVDYINTFELIRKLNVKFQ